MEATIDLDGGRGQIHEIEDWGIGRYGFEGLLRRDDRGTASEEDYGSDKKEDVDVGDPETGTPVY